MKKIEFLLAGLVIMMMVGSMSCKKKTTDPADEPPSITLQKGTDYISANTTVVVKDTLKFGIRPTPNSSSGASLSGLTFTRTFNGISYDTTYTLPNYNVDLTTIANNVAGNETFTFTIKDANGASASTQVVITTVIPTSLLNKSQATDPEKSGFSKQNSWIVR